jgi:hypothetical protein
VRRRIAGWAWLRGAGALDVAEVSQLARTLTPGVFTVHVGNLGCFVTFAAEAPDPPRLDRVAGEVRQLAEAVRLRLPVAEVQCFDEMVR